MKILITGANGTIGSDLVKFFSKNYKVYGVYRTSNKINKSMKSKNIIWIMHDLKKKINFNIKPSIVIHCAVTHEFKKNKSIKDYIDSNVISLMNLINFSKRFKKVIGIEKSTINYNIMKNNIEVYGLKNIEIYNNSFIKIIPELCGNVVFIDPPWGGRKYRYKTNIMLHLDKVYIYDIVNQIPNSTKLIAIKIPYNFDYSSFITKIYPNQSISHWSVNNYNLITIVRE